MQARCDAASEAKTRCETEAQRTAFSLNLANRLLGGLASERQRWSALARRFRQLERSLAGDVLLASAFVAYLGPFTAPYRRQLQQEYWRPFLESKVSFQILNLISAVTHIYTGIMNKEESTHSQNDTLYGNFTCNRFYKA